jgi:hypothetical protein
VFPAAMTAQYGEPAWLYTIDAFNDADISDLEVDDQGNTYVTVNYMGTLNLEGNNGRLLDPASHMHGVLLKLSPQGKLIWSRGFKSAFDNRINDLTIGPDGGVFVTGFGDGLMNFPGKSDNMLVGRERGPNEYHQPQGIYLAKYSKDGDRMWVHYWNTTWGEGKSIAVNSKGEVAWSYYHYTDLTRDGELIDAFPRTESSKVKVSLAWFNPDGKLNRIEPFQFLPSDSNVKAPSLRFDRQDHFYCFGLFKGSIHLSPTDSLTNDGYYESWDSYLAKYDNQNKLLWKRQLGGQNIQLLDDIDIAADGSIYGTGQYSYECILMDGIKPAYKSAYEYKSGNNFFLFHLFDDGETDFMRYQEGKGYNGSFMGVSIDQDVNDLTHVIGSFTDTLEIDGFDLQGVVYPSSGFISTWEGSRLVQLDEIARMEKSWYISTGVRSSETAYAVGGMYYGEDVRLKINGSDVKLSSKDYGRGSAVFGGAVKRKEPHEEVLAEQREARRLERLESIEALFACTSKELADSPTTWYPVIPSEPGTIEPGGQATVDPLLSNSPCGVLIEEMEASLFPNPTTGPVTVRLKGMEGSTTQLDVFSDKGQLIYSQRVQVPANDYNVEFDMANAATGTYFVRITHAGFEKALRLVRARI